MALAEGAGVPGGIPTPVPELQLGEVSRERLAEMTYVPKIPPNHSYSRFSTFSSECERRYFFDALFPEAEADKGPALREGSHVHKALELFALLRQSGVSVGDCVESLRANPPEGPLTCERLMSYVDRVAPMFETLEVVEAESRFTSVAGMPIKGFVDLVSETTLTGARRRMVLDWKTTGNPMRAMEAVRTIKESLQLQLYCLAKGVADAAYVFLLPDPHSPPIIGEVTFNSKDLALAAKWLHGTIRTIDKRWAAAKEDAAPGQDWNPEVFALARPGMSWCNARWCRHWNRCLGNEPEPKE